MDISSIIKTAGPLVLNTVSPGLGTAAATLVNAFLPEGDKIHAETATGEDLETALNKLPAEKKVELLSKQLDVQAIKLQNDAKEAQMWFNIQQKFAEMEINGATTRPRITWGMAICVWIGLGLFFLGMFINLIAASYAVFKDPTNIQYLQDALPDYALIGVALTIPSYILRSYFGDRGKDKELHAEILTGGVVTRSKGTFETLMSKIRG